MTESQAGGVKRKNKTKEVFRDESAQFNLSSKFYQENPRQNLAFVNLTVSSGTRQDSEKRRLVRSHVGQNVHQRKQMEEYSAWPVFRPAGMEIGTFTRKGTAEAQISWDDEGVNGNSIELPNSEPNQSFHVVAQEKQLSPQIPWVSRTSTATIHTAVPTGGIPFQLGSSNMENMELHGSNYNAHLDEPNLEMLNPQHLEEQSSGMINLQFIQEPGSEILDSQQIQETSLKILNSQVSGVILTNLNIELVFPSRGRIDPFDTMPSLRNGQAEALMYHYNQVLVSSMLAVAVDPEKKWFGYSLTDPALFHSTMLHSAAHNAMLAGNTDLADPMLLKWDALKLINDSLSDPVLSLSDTTIGAVVALLLFENQSANVEISNIHINGVYQMVNLRGGVQNLGLAGILKRKILWADVCNSMFSYSKPRFNNSLPSKFNINERDILPLPAGSTFAKFQSYNRQLMGILTSLRSFSSIIAVPFLRTNIAIDEIYSMERRVVVLLAETNPTIHPDLNLNPNEQSILWEHRRSTYQISLAAQIYIYLFFRDNLVPSPIFSVLVSRLSHSLYSSDSGSRPRGTFQEWGGSDTRENGYGNEILFWALVLGSFAAEGREERYKFETYLRTVCDSLRIHNFTEFVEKLEKTAWIENKIDYKLLELWSQVQGLW